ncbi:pyridoxal phosphate-dependent aminotransferase [Subtercola sp. RTI3]|uniref:pyridoxal phosphate-dependent aminotransferase n=1 Tax=Subtercola sp. RTI3 TaxID=3048639 RepID=UPI002B239F5D|nr:aminotransferase class I/II-fold pyridoxal phosphate-dependent enzyme [Subtercola sp. RTI3]MEA9986164.1 aminotransferase class I/II-fold pyridoxal phosphate-dependent enzyme [Subtercola sp. RTI3]
MTTTAPLTDSVDKTPGSPSERVLRTHLPQREAAPGVSVRAADLSLRLDGGGNGLLDTTHFDTVRFPPPPWVAADMAAAIDNGAWAYSPYRGDPTVLEALSAPISAFLGSPVASSNLALTPGTQGALFTTLAALVNEGDLVLLADPDYLFCERILAFLGARVERVPLVFDSAEPSLDLDVLEELILQKPKLLLFSHPNNPTGAVYSEAMIARVAELAVEGDFLVMVDELYSRLVYEDTPFHHLRVQPGMAERSITLLGPSKTESMSGFRIGVIVAPEAVIDTVEQCLAMTSLRAPAYSQHLLARWLVDDHAFLAERITELENLKNLTIEKLSTVAGLVLTPQKATAYLFVDVSAFGATDVEIAGALQREAQVIVSPGYQFGARGTGHFRICYARDEAEWEAALDLMVTCLGAFAARAGITS